jgi:hypothetical protein
MTEPNAHNEVNISPIIKASVKSIINILTHHFSYLAYSSSE